MKRRPRDGVALDRGCVGPRGTAWAAICISSPSHRRPRATTAWRLQRRAATQGAGMRWPARRYQRGPVPGEPCRGGGYDDAGDGVVGRAVRRAGHCRSGCAPATAVRVGGGGAGRTERQPCSLSEASVENHEGAISAAEGLLALAWR